MKVHSSVFVIVLGPVVDRAPAPVHTQELHRRVLEQRWELLEGLIDPGSNVSDGGGKKICVLAPRRPPFHGLIRTLVEAQMELILMLSSLGFLDISIQKYTTVRTISDEVKRKSKGLKELKYSMCV